jgi:hypothetical protein
MPLYFSTRCMAWHHLNMSILYSYIYIYNITVSCFSFVLSHDRTWIFHVTFRVLFVFRDNVRGGCLFCWYWWNCLPSLLKLIFIKTYTHYAEILRVFTVFCLCFFVFLFVCVWMVNWKGYSKRGFNSASIFIKAYLNLPYSNTKDAKRFQRINRDRCVFFRYVYYM